jgi:hypothetical protein
MCFAPSDAGFSVFKGKVAAKIYVLDSDIEPRFAQDPIGKKQELDEVKWSALVQKKLGKEGIDTLRDLESCHEVMELDPLFAS